MNLNILLEIIIRDYFQLNRCLLIFNEGNDIVSSKGTISFQTSLPVVQIQTNDGAFNESFMLNYFGCQGILINAREPSNTLANVEQAIRRSMERFNKRRYLILSSEENFNFDFFKLKELQHIADLLLIVPSRDLYFLSKNHGIQNPSRDDKHFSFFTHKFVGSQEQNLKIYLGTFHIKNQRFTNNTSLYPEKLKNGFGRSFKIATFTYKPYSIPEFHEGTELRIALEFCKTLNLTPKYTVDEAGEWGEIYENWTGYGVLGNVLSDKGDVGLAALYTWAHEYAFLDLSKPVVRTGITCLTPAPTLAAGWLVPLFSFRYDMWIGVGLSFMLSSLILGLLSYHHYQTNETPKNSNISRKLKCGIIAGNSFFSTFAIFSLQSDSTINAKTTGKAQILFYGCLFVFSLLLTSSYSSGLASSMTVPRYTGAILTVQELVDSGIQWGATSTAWIMSIMGAPEQKYRILVERFTKTDQETLKKFNHKKFAFSVERLPAGQFAIGDYVTEEGASGLRLMREDIYWEYCVLMTRKSSIWMPQLDNFILVLAQTGIPTVWEYTVATKHLNSKIQRTVAYSIHHNVDHDKSPEKLQWQHVQGAFALWIFGVLLGLISFFVEITLGRVKRRPLENYLQ